MIVRMRRVWMKRFHTHVPNAQSIRTLKMTNHDSPKIDTYMKKYLLIFALGILCSCNPTPEIKTDTGVVRTVQLYGNKKYKYRVGVYYPTYKRIGRVIYF